MYQPPDALYAPRYTGPRTYGRLPYVTDLAGVDCAVFGIPWDGGASFRPGARFGPEGVRSASGMIRTFNASLDIQIFGSLSVIDYGDSPTVPGYIEDTLVRIETFVTPIVKAGVVPIGIGGDHSGTLAELRAVASVYGPLGMVHLDAHTDLWDSYFGRPYSHGTMFRRAIEEGIVDPGRVIQGGMHGSLYGEADRQIPAELGVEMLPWDTLSTISPRDFAARARRRLAGKPAFLTFDVDFVDAAFCPGTGTPEVGGPTSYQALSYLRALTEIDFRGFDVVEVSPPYDGPGQITALLAANAIFDMLGLVARGRNESKRPAEGKSHPK
jgi:agmatinase